jgi:signal transduction histidine kinase/ActR/RegA family two-component response regulator
MRLAPRLTLTVVLASLGLCVATAIATWSIFMPRFEAIEQQRARNEAVRLRDVAIEEFDDVGNAALLIGEYISRSGVTGATPTLHNMMRHAQIDTISIYQGSTKAQFSAAISPEAEAFRDRARANRIANDVGERIKAGERKTFNGLAESDGVLAITTITAYGGGAVPGRLVATRLISPERLATWRKRTGVAFQLTLLSSGDLRPRRETLITANEIVNAYTLRALTGEYVGRLEVSTPRTITKAGREAILIGAFAMMATILIAALLVGLASLRSVVGPINRLRIAIQKHGRTSAEAMPGLDRTDEIGDLAREFDSLLVEAAAKNADLAQALARADEAAHAKSEFFAAVSHEIRTPLNGILGIAHVLKTRQEAAALYEDLDVILASGELLLAVLNDVLDYSKIEAGAFLIDPADANLGDLAEGIEALWGSTARQKALNLSVRIAPEARRRVRIDFVRVRQIAFNFINNAVKFTPAPGAVSVRIWIPERNILRIEVVDTSPGISVEQQQRLFLPFSQLKDRRRGAGGTGLGLAICRRLAELMGGAVGVESEPGRGACFWTEIPFEAASELAGDGDDVEAASRANALDILVAEDNPTNQRVIKALLNAMGARVTVADDGAEATELAGTVGFDLILMDVHMPIMDGLAATQAIRASDGPNRNVPIVALTASVDASDRHAAMASGMNGFIAKPINPTSLAQGIADALARKETPNASDGAAA